MTSAELIKALRNCADEDKVCTEQTNCGYYSKGFFCQHALLRDAVDAIERLTAEVEELTKERLKAEVEELTKERLKGVCEIYWNGGQK